MVKDNKQNKQLKELSEEELKNVTGGITLPGTYPGVNVVMCMEIFCLNGTTLDEHGCRVCK